MQAWGSCLTFRGERQRQGSAAIRASETYPLSPIHCNIHAGVRWGRWVYFQFQVFALNPPKCPFGAAPQDENARLFFRA